MKPAGTSGTDDLRPARPGLNGTVSIYESKAWTPGGEQQNCNIAQIYGCSMMFIQNLDHRHKIAQTHEDIRISSNNKDAAAPPFADQIC